MAIRVLVVDDEPDVEVLFPRRFQREVREGHCTIEFALSGEAALDNLAGELREEVGFLVSGIKMPGISGLDLLPTVNERRPNLPVFMMSAFGDMDTMAIAMARGANECFTKPIDFPKLEQEIEVVVNSPRRRG